MEFIDIPHLVSNKRPPNVCLSSEMEFLPSGDQLVHLLHKTAEYLKTLTNSDGYIFYSFEEALGELYICPIASSKKHNLTNRYRWNIENGGTIAIYAFKQRTPILVDAYTSVDLNYPYLQDVPNLYPQYILSLPLASFHKHCFGVVELYRSDDGQYSETEVEMCQFLLKNCAEAFKQSENAVFYSKFNEVQLKNQEFLEMYSFRNEDDKSFCFLKKVVEMARDYTRAMSSCIFFEKRSELVRVVSTDHGYCFKQDNTKNGHGSIIRSVVSVNFHTSLMNRNITGTVKVCNKIAPFHFSLLDEQLLEAFAKMCALWSTIEHMGGYVKKQKSLNGNIMDLINMQLQNAGDFGKKPHTLESSDLKSLNSWKYSPETCTEGKHLSSDIVKMISLVKGDLPIINENLQEFVLMVELCHRNDGEVGFRHTVLCVQGLYLLLEGCKNIANEKETFSMLIASLCHNIAVNDAPTATSSIFGRYNLYPKKLMRFEIVQFLIQETRLLKDCDLCDQQMILEKIKKCMIDMNLQHFKRNIVKFSEVVKNVDMKKLEVEKNLEIQILTQSVLPGIGNILGYFRSEVFCENFPNFFLFQYLEKKNLTCFDIILAVSPI